MKKAILLLVSVVVVLVAVMVFRTLVLFGEQQVLPLTGQLEVDIDLAAVQRFSQALTFPTVSHDDRSNFDSAAFLDFHAFLQSAYPQVHRYTQRTVVNDYSLVYHLEGNNPLLEPVLFMSHMDVVPIQEDTRDKWTYPPFAGVVDKGIIWGRGTLDDKIGVVALMEALEKMLSEGTRPERGVWFAFGHDEEVGGFDGAREIAAWFKQRGVRFDFILDEGGAVTRGVSGDLEGPLAVIGTSEKGYVNLELTVTAAGGHSSQPPEQTALGILSRAIVNVEDNPFPARLDTLMPTFEAVGAHSPFGKRLVMANLWLLSPLVKSALLKDDSSASGIRTTTAATMATGSPKSNILPTRATAVINFRIMPGETVESVKKRVIGLIDDERVDVQTEFGVDPSPVSPIDTRGYRLLASLIRGMDENVLVAPYMVRGGTDAKYFYELSANVYRFLMVRIDPETMQYIHGIDERIAVNDFMEAIRFYYHLLHQATAPAPSSIPD